MSIREKAVVSSVRKFNRQWLFKKINIMFNSPLIIYDNPSRFYQRYKLANWYLPELLNVLTSRHLATKAVLVALESEHFQLLKINTEARLNKKYGVSYRLVYLMIKYYRRRYAEWSAQNEDKIVEYKWHNENVRYYQDPAYQHKMNQKINNFQNPKLPF